MKYFTDVYLLFYLAYFGKSESLDGVTKKITTDLGDISLSALSLCLFMTLNFRRI